MIKLLLHESKRRVGSPGVFITPGTYFMITSNSAFGPNLFYDFENTVQPSVPMPQLSVRGAVW